MRTWPHQCIDPSCPTVDTVNHACHDYGCDCGGTPPMDLEDLGLARMAIAIAESKVGYRSDISMHDYDNGRHLSECRWCKLKEKAGI